MNDQKPDHDIEVLLQSIKPPKAAQDYREKVISRWPAPEAPVANPPATELSWQQLFYRLAIAPIAVAVTALLIWRPWHDGLNTERPKPSVAQATMTNSTASIQTFLSIETNRLILSSQPVGLLTTPDETPIQLVRVRWLDFSRAQSPAGDQLVIGYPNEQIIPVALTIN